MLQPIRYGFSQRLNLPARKAYEWCTDFKPEDPTLMQEKNTTREVQRITEHTFILIDKIQDGAQIAIKQKLVCLYPERLMWVSTHLTGPAENSQFIYEIKSVTRTTSKLRFTALYIGRDIKEGIAKVGIEGLVEELRTADSDVWKNLAREMEKDMRLSRTGARSVGGTTFY